MIKIAGLNKSFGSEEVLKGLNLTIQDGEITVILGRSGAGKSVLLKHIIGLVKPDDGKIFVNGDEITSMAEKELNRVRVHFGMLFQEGALFDSLSVWENIAFPLVERERLPKSEVSDPGHQTDQGSGVNRNGRQNALRALGRHEKAGRACTGAGYQSRRSSCLMNRRRGLTR